VGKRGEEGEEEGEGVQQHEYHAALILRRVDSKELIDAVLLSLHHFSFRRWREGRKEGGKKKKEEGPHAYSNNRFHPFVEIAGPGGGGGRKKTSNGRKRRITFHSSSFARAVRGGRRGKREKKKKEEKKRRRRNVKERDSSPTPWPRTPAAEKKGVGLIRRVSLRPAAYAARKGREKKKE